MARRRLASGRFAKKKRSTARRSTRKGQRRKTARRAYTGLKRRRRRRNNPGGSMKGKALIMKQVGAAAGAGTLGALIGGGTIQAAYGPLPTTILAAGLGALGTLWSRNDLMLGLSLGLTGMAAGELGAKVTSAGVAGLGDESWGQSTYAPAEDVLGYHEEDDYIIGEEDYIYADEIEI